MKKLTKILLIVIPLLARNVHAQGTQQRVINTTSAFARQILTNETAAEWAAQILLGTNFNFGNFVLLNGTNVYTGTNTFNAPFYATNPTNIFGGNGLALTVAAANIQAGTVTNAIGLTNTANVVTGVGTGLTALTPANISAGTVSNAIAMTNTANNFAGSFTGNGAGLTNVSGGGGGSPSGPASGDLSGAYPGPSVASVGGVTAANVGTGAAAANAATSVNTPGTIVKRDGSGNIAAGAIVGTSFTGNGSGLTGLNVSNASVNLVNWTAQLGNMISNVAPTTNLMPVLIGLVSGHAGSHFWTNSAGSWKWTNNGVITNAKIGDYIIMLTTSEQPTLVYYPTTNAAVAYSLIAALNSYTNAQALINPGYLAMYDTVPRQTGFITDAGGIGVLGNDIGNADNGYIFGGGTNWGELERNNDTSGNGIVFSEFGTENPNAGVVMEIYDGVPGHALDVLAPAGVVRGMGGIASLAANAQIGITSTGITNTYTNNANAFVTGGAFNAFTHAGTQFLTNINNVTNFLVPLQPGGSVVGTGLSGSISPW